VSCAKTAELIDLLFGLWTRVGQRKHSFNRICQVATMCTNSVVFARWRQCAWRPPAVKCAKIAELIDLPFGLWTLVGRRKHKFNCICQVAPVSPYGRAHHIGATWGMRLNRLSAAAMRPYVRLLWPLVVLLLSKPSWKQLHHVKKKSATLLLTPNFAKCWPSCQNSFSDTLSSKFLAIKYPATP